MTFPLPPELPSLGTLDGPRLGEYSAATMSNGLSVWCARRTAVPLVSVRLVIRGGRALDPPDRPGLATLLASSQREGTGSRTGGELSALAQSAGGDLAVAAGDDTLVVAATGLAARLDLLLELVADVARNPAFHPGDVERVKSLALEDLATDETDPSFLAGREFRRGVYGSHPYAVVSPTMESIADLNPEVLRREASRRILPSRTLLLIVGDIDPAPAAAAAGRLLGDWRDAACGPPEPGPAEASSGARPIVLLDRPGSVQTELRVGVLGLSRRDPDAFALHLASSIYGGSFSSRLVTNLREEKGYTYSPASSVRWSRWSGLVVTAAAVRNEVTGAALNEILYERGRMAATDPADEEMERARARELGEQVLSVQTNAGLAGELADLWLNDLGPEELPRAAQALRALTKADVRRASRRFFGARSVRIVAVGDAHAIRGELEPFGEVEVVGARAGRGQS